MANESKTWEQLTHSIKTTVAPVVDKALRELGNKTIRSILNKCIQTEVYDAYTPQPGAWINGTTYERRNSLLRNSAFYQSVKRKGDEFTLTVTSNARPRTPIVKGSEFTDKSTGYFLRILAGENHGIWRKGFPRDPIGAAQQIVDKTDYNRIDLLLQQEIEKQSAELNK